MDEDLFSENKEDNEWDRYFDLPIGNSKQYFDSPCKGALEVKINELSDSCRRTIKSHPKQTIAIVIIAIVIIVLICLLSLRGCSTRGLVETADTRAAGSSGAAASTSTESRQSTEGSTATSDATEAGTTQSGQTTGTETQGGAAQDSSAGQQGNLTSAGSDDGSTAPTPSNSSSASNAPSGGGGASTAPSRTWVVDYAQTWVQDSAAWDESVPTYGREEKSICNVCRADITGNETAHGKAHMMAGEGSGHHTEYVQVVIGSTTVHHDATGHYETVESGGHWE